jgi:F-type H+-transporting ATPase subunit a
MEHGGGAHEIGVHKLAQFAGLTFNIDTLYMTWLSMAIVIGIAYLATRRLSLVPGGWQNILEMAVTALLDQIESTMGAKGKRLAPLIITLFLFLLISNWQGLIPGLTSPTSDLNTTLGLALMVITLVHVLGIINKGPLNYLKHFFQPYLPFVVINIIEELAKPITLSFRLFGNILAGEVLIIILGLLVPYFVPTLWLAFSVFVGIIQAFIFTMLSMSYLANSVQNDHH